MNNKLKYLLQVHPIVFHLSRSTVSCIAWVVICNSLFVYEGTYLTSNLFLYALKVALMADSISRRQCGSNAMRRTCLSQRTQASDTPTNSCNSFALNNARDKNVIFTLEYSYVSRGHYTQNQPTNNRQTPTLPLEQRIT